jgi:hypothetical protein
MYLMGGQARDASPPAEQVGEDLTVRAQHCSVEQWGGLTDGKGTAPSVSDPNFMLAKLLYAGSMRLRCGNVFSQTRL